MTKALGVSIFSTVQDGSFCIEIAFPDGSELQADLGNIERGGPDMARRALAAGLRLLADRLATTTTTTGSQS